MVAKHRRARGLVAMVETGSRLPSIRITPLPRIIHRQNPAKRSLNSSTLHRVFIASADPHNQTSLISHALFVPICAGGTSSVERSPVTQKADETPHVPRAPLHIIGPTRENIFNRACFS